MPAKCIMLWIMIQCQRLMIVYIDTHFKKLSQYGRIIKIYQKINTVEIRNFNPNLISERRFIYSKKLVSLMRYRQTGCPMEYYKRIFKRRNIFLGCYESSNNMCITKMTIKYLIALFLFLIHSANSENDNQWVRGAFRINTNMSAGKNSVRDIAEIAREKDIEFLVFTDQFIVLGEYGIPPFRNILKYAKERRSIKTFGIENYLQEIKSTQNQFPDIFLIPGADVAPIYEWTGSLFNPPIVGNRWSQQITVLGSEDAKFYHNLPTIHNNPIGWKFPDSILKWLPFPFIVLSIWIIQKGITKYHDHQGHSYSIYEKPKIALGSIIFLISALYFINNRPFSVTRYSQYKNNKLEPFQNLINYVNSNNALAFWSHPEMEMKGEYGPFLFNKFGKVILHSLPYLDDVESTQGHNGLAGLYGDAITAYLPGKTWDRILRQYCQGTRTVRPVIIGEIDYHMDRPLDLILTVVQVSQKNKREILNALKDGKSYAIMGGITRHLSINEAKILSLNKSANMGETLIADEEEISLSISGEWQTSNAASKMPIGEVFIILNGRMVHQLTMNNSPFSLSQKIKIDPLEKKQYVRFYMKFGGDTLLSNPMFIEKTN